jgi:hypothetical protein
MSLVEIQYRIDYRAWLELHSWLGRLRTTANPLRRSCPALLVSKYNISSLYKLTVGVYVRMLARL